MKEATIEQVLNAFDVALDKCRAYTSDIKIPNLSEILDIDWVDSVPDRTLTQEERKELMDIKDNKDISGNGNYFRFGKGTNVLEPYAKIYSSIRADSAVSLFDKLANHFNEDSNKIDFEGKFWDCPGDANSFIIYVSFENMPKIVEFLSKERTSFHNHEWNHYLGVQLFPGVSAVIDRDMGDSFDEANTKLQKHFGRAGSIITKDDLPEYAHLGKMSEQLGYHFRYLDQKSTPKYLGPVHWSKLSVNSD